MSNNWNAIRNPPAGHRVEDDFLEFPPLNKSKSIPRLQAIMRRGDHAGVEIAPPRQMEKLYIVLWCVEGMDVSKESGGYRSGWVGFRSVFNRFSTRVGKFLSRVSPSLLRFERFVYRMETRIRIFEICCVNR